MAERLNLVYAKVVRGCVLQNEAGGSSYTQMDEILIRAWHDAVSRAEGPMHFRLVIQPVMAIILALRSGKKDAKEGRPPFLSGIFSNGAHRKYLLTHGCKDIGRVFIMAALTDVIFQLMVLKQVFPLETLVVAVTLSIVPYVLVRGPANRLAQFTRDKK